MTVNDKIYSEIAKDLHLTKATVEKAVLSMFALLVEHMETDNYTPIRMQYLGLWQCKPKRLEHLNKSKKT